MRNLVGILEAKWWMIDIENDEEEDDLKVGGWHT